jgi:predicted sugar kinase
MRFWGEQGRDTAALGQSSWGPTGFAIVPSATAAQQLIDAARAAGAIDAALELHVVTARSRGAQVAALDAR